MSTTKVAVAGATGNLRQPVLHALLDSGFHVIALSRLGGNSSCLLHNPNLTVREVDFGSVRSLIQALSGIEVIVCCFAATAIGQQYVLIDAAVAAGVKRFIPAEFGMDPVNPLCIQLPVSRNSRGLVSQMGCFLDLGIEVGFIIGPARHSASLYNGGDVRFSATLLGDVAKAAVSIIKDQDATANRILYIHSTVTTQNQLIAYAGLETGEEWSTHTVPTDKVKEGSYVQLSKGNVQEAMDGFCKVAMFDPKYGCDFSGRLDNDLLGIHELQEQELRTLVKSFPR